MLLQILAFLFFSFLFFWGGEGKRFGVCLSDLLIHIMNCLNSFSLTSNTLRAMFLYQAVSDVEKAIVEALDKQYVDVVSPLKENLALSTCRNLLNDMYAPILFLTR